MEVFRIRELAKRAGVTPRTVHYYVQQGLLPPPRGRGRGAYYTEEHLTRLRWIRSLQARGVPLFRIRQILSEHSADEIEALLAEPLTGPWPPPTLPAERWTRIALGDGLELHVRLPLHPDRQRRLYALLALLGEDTA